MFKKQIRRAMAPLQITNTGVREASHFQPNPLRQGVVVATLLGTIIALAFFTVSCGAGGGVAAVPNTVSAPALNVSPGSLTFSSQPLGTSSKAQSVTLSNTGIDSINISSLAVSGTNAGDYAQTNNCASSLAAGADCTISVTFTPSATGTRSGALSLSDNAVGSPQTVGFTGTGTSTAPAVSLSPDDLTFTIQSAGATSASQSVILSNTGESALTISSITTSGDFTQSSNCGTTLAAGANCTITVTFTPAAPGTLSGSLTVSDNAAGGPHKVKLQGAYSAPFAGVTTSSLTFNRQSVGTTSGAQTVTVNNTGNASLSIASIALGGTNSGDFAQTNTCGSSVAASSACTINVTFTPTAVGARTASLTILDDSNNVAGNTQSVSLAGTGAGAGVTLSPPSLTFGSQSEGVVSPPQSVTLTNAGNASLTFTSISVTGADASDFAQTNTCGSSVAASGSCTISVTFKPSLVGTETATVAIADSATGSPQTVALTGSGLSGEVSLSPSSMTFPSQNVGTTSSTQSITLSNTGNSSFAINSISITGANAGDFSETNTCGSSLVQSTSCTIAVKFSPAALGIRTASVSIADNASGSPQTVSLAGTGSAPLAGVTATSLTFSSQNSGTTSTAQTFTLNNTGNAALTISSFAFAGADPGDFSETNTCGGSVAASASCTISVTFTPAAGGNRTATLNITDNSNNVAGSQQTVSLTGTGSAPLAGVTATSLTFNSQNLGTTSAAQTFTLNNTGNAALTISSIALAGADPADFAATNTCGGSVAASASCTISVTFTPAAAGSRAATLNITDNSNNVAGSQQSVSLVGTGTSATVSLSASALSFGSQTVGTTSAAQGVNLTNGGSGALTISNIQVTGTDPGDFGMPSNTCGSSLAANASCTVNVTFTPAASGSRTATLTFADSATNSPQSVTLTGTGAVPIAVLSPANFTFASQPDMTSSSPESFTLSNTGGATLSIASIGLAGSNPDDFAQESTCGATLGANSTCTIAVLFTPSAAGSRSGTLVVTDNSNNVAGSTQSSTLAGTGTHDVMLSWTASATAGVTGYYVYRGTTSGGESSTPLNSTPNTETNYMDENVTAGMTYYYVVMAVGSNGVTQSAASSETSAAVPSP